MKYPKIRSAKAIDDRTLVIEFDNKEKKKYDITSLLEKEIFDPLNNSAFFQGGARGARWLRRVLE